MTDLSKMSDADLLALYQQESAKQASGFTAPPRAAPDKIAARSDYTSAVKDIKDQRDAWAGFQPAVQSLDRFEKLNQTQATGNLVNSIPWLDEKSLNPLNIPAFMGQDPQLGEMKSISSNLQTRGVPKGQGAISNFERELFARGTPSIKNQGSVNQNILNYQRATFQQEGDRLEFMDAYLARNGTLNGAPEAWNRYTKTNPYVIDNGNRTALNDKRQPWRAFFGADAPKSQQTGNYTTAQAAALAPIQQRLKGMATKPRAGSRENPLVMTNKSQYAAIPDRAWYVGPDGLRQKGLRAGQPGAAGGPPVGAPRKQQVLTYDPATGDFK